ncbi:MAG TPA: winged helix-turn-helix domain-containing protein [Terriglobales bacterium]|jgi:DNA-binding winged helix-turn-helix (wHTH) protein/tetratricopeptide (TPR) repeat protein
MRGIRPAVDEIELDLGRYELRRSGRRIKLEKKPMELLIFLVTRRGQLVSREDIVRQLWRSDLFVDTERNVNNIVRKIRTALGDDADKPRFLETVVGKGYRFVGPVRVIGAAYPHGDSARNSGRALDQDEGSQSVDRSSIAVLPLLWLGKDNDDQGLSLGFADAVVSRLGNLRGVDVLPTTAVMNVHLAAPASDIASRLDVRFVVHGAIQTIKGQHHLSLEMYDAYLQRSSFTKKYEIDINRRPDVEVQIAKQIAGALNRPLMSTIEEHRPRYSRDPLAYAEFMRGYRLTGAGDSSLMDRASQHLTNAVTRDPAFALAHAMLSFACATRHFEFDPVNSWLEKAEFHCRRSLELAPELAEGYVARAFLLWGPSKNFQHIEAIADLKRALALQNNLPHAYNRLGSILAHIGLLDHAREMFHRGSSFHPKKALSPSIVQVYVWNQEYDAAREQIDSWLAESPGNKYARCFDPQTAMMTGDFEEASRKIDEALKILPEEPLIISLQGTLHALMGKGEAALDCINKACANPKSFGHAHHTYYQIACILAITERPEPAFEWLDRSVSSGFACWPFFLKDPCLENLRAMPEFEMLISTLQAKYPDHLGLL